MNFGNFAILASILASLVAVPAASATITGDISAATAKLAGTSAEETELLPREVSETIGSDSLEKTVKTAFGTATFRAGSETFVSELESPESTVELSRSAGAEKQEYTSSGVNLEIEESASSRQSRCETPEGVLETEMREGERSTVFSGVDRKQVEQECEEAHLRLEESADRLAQIAADVGLIDRELEITELDPEEEYVVVTNTGPVNVDLQGWTISDESEKTFTFQDTQLASGESVTVKSGDAAGDCEEHCWDQNVWNNAGDTAYLRNTEGETVDQFSYGE